MATGGQTKDGYSLVRVGAVRLKIPYRSKPWYTGIVVTGNKIIVIDSSACKVLLHRLQDGNLLAATDKLESWPLGISLINDMEVCVILSDGTILMMKVDSRNETDTITRTRTLHVKGGLDVYHGVVTFKDKLVVCGTKDGMVCWCVVSLDDGNVVDTIHQICKGDRLSLSYLTVKDKMIYISCYDGPYSPNTGVYGFDIENPSKYKYRYKHEDLKNPDGIAIDQHGFLFVCNVIDCIHQLTDKCQLVSIYRQGIPHHLSAIFWDQQDGHLYVTCLYSNDIHIYRPQYPDSIIPSEVLNMDKKSLEMYKKALRDGQEKVYNIRVMVVGQYGVGKTTLTKRLLGKDVKISDRKSTEGIETHIECCKVSLTTGEWITQEKNVEQYSRLQRLVKLLNERVQKQESEGEQVRQSEVISEEYDNGHSQHDQPVSEEQDINQEVKPFSQPVESPIVVMDPESIIEVKSTENEKKKDAVMEILQSVNENSDKLKKSMMEYAALAVWDFAGQYVFYTTHQTFLTSRAIYLLVLDLSQQVKELIEDDKCYRDMEGIKPCKVHDLIEIWLNSIHSCAPSPQAGTPPVILVGTHVDKIPEKSRQKVISQYFMKIRKMLKDKPIVLHLMDSIAIDNTQYDPNLEDLKERIFELASQQPHWGEEKPARWLPLEQRIITLKASGVKVVPLSLIEEINRSGSVKIEGRDELIAFLSFQHEMGTILYFSVEELREKIVLDPQWMIDALKSLITAEMFIIQKPAITKPWFDFRDKGKLTHELIDAIWAEEKNREFGDNKEHILLLMEKLHVIAKPSSYTEDRKEVKKEDYYLAPCMLRQATPNEIIAPKSDPKLGTTSVLCFVSTAKFLPPPVFHRLVSACLTDWPIAQQKSDNLIYCGSCVFDLDEFHRLTLHFRDYVIFARVTGVGVTDMCQSSDLCSTARKFIFVNLARIIGNLGQSLQLELHVQCPDSDADSLEGLIPVSQLQKNEKVRCNFHDKSHILESKKLLQFWFKDKDDKERLRRERRKKREKKNKKDWKERTFGSQDDVECQISTDGDDHIKSQHDDNREVRCHHKSADSADREQKLRQRDEDDSSSRRKHRDDGLEKRRHRRDEEDDGRERRHKNRDEDNDEEIERRRHEKKEKRRHERRERREREERERGQDEMIESPEWTEQAKTEKSKGKDGRDTGKWHHKVLNQCRPVLVRDLDFSTVSDYIIQEQLFDDVTMREISEQRTTPDKIRELIKRIQQRGQDTYDKFKDCLVQAKQADLKTLLEREEAAVAMGVKEKHEVQGTGIHHSVLRIRDSILRRLSKDLISHNWKFFFRELSVADHDLDRVQIDYRESVQEQIYQLLRRLNQRGSLNKTSIIEALMSIERNDLVDKYSKKKFSKS